MARHRSNGQKVPAPPAAPVPAGAPARVTTVQGHGPGDRSRMPADLVDQFRAALGVSVDVPAPSVFREAIERLKRQPAEIAEAQRRAVWSREH